jgi:hypothetical protein
MVGFEDKSSPKTWVRHLSKGKNVLLWNVIKNGFLAQDSVIIYNYGFKVDAGEDQHLCDPYSTLSASGPRDNPLLSDTTSWTGDWDTPVGGVNYENRFEARTAIDSIKAMTNVLVWHVKTVNKNLYTDDRDRLTCYASDTVRVTYYVPPVPEFVINPTSASGCSPFEAMFANTTPIDSTMRVMYTWNFGNTYSFETYDRDTLIERTFTNTDNKNYVDSIVPIWLVTSIRIPSNAVCYDTTAHDITVYPELTSEFSVSPDVQRQPAMNANLYTDSIPTDHMVYRWNFGDNNGDVWNSPADYKSTLVHTYETWGEYVISLKIVNTRTTCSDSTSRIFTIIPAPPTSLIPNTKYYGCDDFDFLLEESLQYHDSVRWDIRRYVKSDSLVAEANYVVKAGDMKRHMFTDPGLYYLYLSAYGPGTPG